MQENKTFYLRVKGKRLEVSEEVYRAYVRPIRAEQRAKKRRKRCRVIKKTESGAHYFRCDGDCSKCPLYLSGKAFPEVVSLEAVVDGGHDEPDLKQDLEKNVIRSEEYSELYSAISKLDERTQKVILLFYFHNKTQEQIAKLLGLTQQAVSYIIKSASKQLKKFLKNF